MPQYPTGKTGMLAILADPVAHVRAAWFMNPAFEGIGYDLFITPMHVRPADLEHVARALTRVANYRGVILTIPHKETMAKLCDELGPQATMIGAVNTVRFDNGRLVGEIFDGIGLMNALDKHGFAVAGRKILLIGAGGAGRAIAFALCQKGVGKLGIHNRTPARAERLVADIKNFFPDIETQAASADPRGYDMVVNCTSLGLHADDPLPLDAELLDPSIEVVDIIAARDTELMAAAEANGCKVMGGEPMAVGQVAEQASFLDPNGKP